MIYDGYAHSQKFVTVCNKERSEAISFLWGSSLVITACSCLVEMSSFKHRKTLFNIQAWPDRLEIPKIMDSAFSTKSRRIVLFIIQSSSKILLGTVHRTETSHRPKRIKILKQHTWTWWVQSLGLPSFLCQLLFQWQDETFKAVLLNIFSDGLYWKI